VNNECSLCGTSDKETKLIEGVDGFICYNCAESSVEAFQDMDIENKLTGINFLRPHEIKAELDKYLIGQDEAKKIFSVAVYNHYKRINSQSKVSIQKSNILLTGPTGSGKTYMMQTLADILNVPIYIADATSLTQSGYVGNDVETILENLLLRANGDIERAEKGIIYIDEIDKITSKNSNGQRNSLDVGGEGVQQSLLKIIEDSEVHLKVGKNVYEKRKVVMQTKNILFVCGGAFVGLEDIIKKRINNKDNITIGFATNVIKTDESISVTNEITEQDIINYGLIPELVGRIPVITTLNPLTRQDLADILVKPKNSIIKQYQALLKMDGVKVTFDASAIDYIAEEAIRKNTGARGLKSVIEKRMYDLMFDLPQNNDITDYIVTKETLLNKKMVELI